MGLILEFQKNSENFRKSNFLRYKANKIIDLKCNILKKVFEFFSWT